MGSREEIIKRLAEYFRSCPYPVTLVYLFGSASRGETTPLSDVDVAVYLDGLDRTERVRLYLPLLAALQEVVGDGEVDLVYLNDAPSGLAYRIIGGWLLYCADEGRRVEVEASVLSTYIDEQMLHEARYRLVRRRILTGRMRERGLDVIDRRVINERLEYIRSTLARLNRHRGLSLEEFLADEDGYRASLYDLQTCLEAIADIGNQIIAAMALRKPRDRRDIMAVLAKAGVIPKPLGERLGKAQAMRNIIVHGYLDIVLDEVYKVIQEGLGDIEEFCRDVISYVDRVTEGRQGVREQGR
jgi:uncharacterized protein YutE (UPF0331/DUF86 family)/predicted nucleotidyltransferase